MFYLLTGRKHTNTNIKSCAFIVAILLNDMAAFKSSPVSDGSGQACDRTGVWSTGWVDWISLAHGSFTELWTLGQEVGSERGLGIE